MKAAPPSPARTCALSRLGTLAGRTPRLGSLLAAALVFACGAQNSGAGPSSGTDPATPTQPAPGGLPTATSTDPLAPSSMGDVTSPAVTTATPSLPTVTEPGASTAQPPAPTPGVTPPPAPTGATPPPDGQPPPTNPTAVTPEPTAMPTLPAGVLRVMAVGDSITETTCGIPNLSGLLDQRGFGDRVDFVGTRPNQQGCNPTSTDRETEGRGGTLISDAGLREMLRTAIPQNPADIALLHYGTNDIWNGNPIEPIITGVLAGYTEVVGFLRAANPNVVIFAAQIITLAAVPTAACPGCTCTGACLTHTAALNDAIPAWAAGLSTAQSPIVVVDQEAGFNSAAGQDTDDGVHPNAAGSLKMAEVWYAALQPLL